MVQLDNEKIKWLKEKARDLRISVIEMLAETGLRHAEAGSGLAKAGSGHTAGALGMADIFTALFFHILKHDPTNPGWEERDRLILSNGHICPVYYAALAHSGYIKMEELKTLRKLGSRLQGHPDRRFLPLLETSSGPLGCGLSQTVGMALADGMNLVSSIKNKNEVSSKRFFCLLSDGELDEGNVWEGVMLAGKERLNNLIAIIDRNKIQLSGNTENVMPLEPLAKKFESFGWHAEEIDGHDFNQIISAVENAKTVLDKPTVIIANTVPGKGVSFMENNYKWHGKVPNKEETELALKELRSMN